MQSCKKFSGCSVICLSDVVVLRQRSNSEKVRVYKLLLRFRSEVQSRIRGRGKPKQRIFCGPVEFVARLIEYDFRTLPGCQVPEIVLYEHPVRFVRLRTRAN